MFACASELMPPERMQMIEKDTAKLEKRLKRRSSSCAYPMPWRTFMSSFLSTSVYATPDATCCLLVIVQPPLSYGIAAKQNS